MTHEAYSTKRVTVWEAQRDGQPGMAIKYADGYQSWCPKHVYERDYQAIGRMSFGHALHALEAGHAVSRSGWNGKSMFIVMMPALYLPPFSTQDTTRKVNDRTAKWIGKDAPLDCQPYIAMYTATKQWQPGWLASQADMLAKDWGIVEVVEE